MVSRTRDQTIGPVLSLTLLISLLLMLVVALRDPREGSEQR